MPRISVPVSEEFMRRYEERIPWSIRAQVVKKLLETLMRGDKDIIWKIAHADTGTFEIKEKS